MKFSILQKRKDKCIEELYKIYKKFGVSESEFDKLIKELRLQKKKTEGILNDLVLYPFVKIGLATQHFKMIAELLGKKHYNSNNLFQRLANIENIIKQIREGDMK